MKRGFIDALIVIGSAATIAAILLAYAFKDKPLEPFFGATPALTVPQGGTGTTTIGAGKLLVGTTNSLRVTDVGTSSVTINAPLTTSGTAGALVGGTNLTIDIDDIKAADLDLTDITLNDFTNDANFLTTVDISANTNAAVTFPITLTNDTFGFNGLSTSSPISAASGLLYATGVNTLASVSTSSAISLSITGNAGTATALAADGGNCSAGNFPLGVDTLGAVQNCTDAWTEAENTAAAYTPQSRTLTVAGTANQITSSAGAQDLSANRTWTLSLPNHVIFPSSYQAALGSTTDATSTNLHVTSATNDVLAATAAGRVYATTTGLLTAGTGISLDSSVRRLIGGAAAITNTGVISASCSGGTTCSGTNPLAISSFGFPYTATTNFAATANSTTTPIWFRGYPISLQASSTAWFDQLQVGSTTATTLATSTFFADVAFRRTASTTNLIVSGAPNGPLSTNQAGLVVASTTGAVTAGTGISLDSSVRQIFGGALQITNSGVTSAVAGSGISLSGGTGAVTITANSPFTPNAAATFYGQVSNSTTTQIHFGAYPNSLSASSTSYFDLINVGSTTASTQATSTFFNNLRIAQNASTSKFFADGLYTCNTGNMLTWANGTFGCEDDTTGAGGGSFPFVPETTYATNTSATSTGLWAKMGIYASTTNNYFQGLTIDNAANSDAWTQYGKSAFEWSVGYNATNNNFVIASSTNLTTSLALTIDKNLLTLIKGGYVSQASSTVVGDFTVTGTTKLAAALTGLALTTSGTVSAYAGTSCLAGTAVSALSASGVATCASFAPFPFTPTTSFGSVANSTSTLLLLTQGLSASSTVRFGNANVRDQFTWDSVKGNLGIGTSTPAWDLQIATGTAPQLALSDGTATSPHWTQRAINNIFYWATSSPTTFATSTRYNIALSSGGQLFTSETNHSTTTNMVIDWLNTPNQVLVQIGGSAMTIGFNNASTTGMTKRVVICNPGSTASTVTWAQTGSRILWPSGTAPTQTTTLNKCDLYSFVISQATSTTDNNPKIFGAQTAGY